MTERTMGKIVILYREKNFIEKFQNFLLFAILWINEDNIFQIIQTGY